MRQGRKYIGYFTRMCRISKGFWGGSDRAASTEFMIELSVIPYQTWLDSTSKTLTYNCRIKRFELGVRFTIHGSLPSPNNMNYNIYICSRNCDQKWDITIMISHKITIPCPNIYVSYIVVTPATSQNLDMILHFTFSKVSDQVSSG